MKDRRGCTSASPRWQPHQRPDDTLPRAADLGAIRHVEIISGTAGQPYGAETHNTGDDRPLLVPVAEPVEVSGYFEATRSERRGDELLLIGLLVGLVGNVVVGSGGRVVASLIGNAAPTRRPPGRG